MQALWGQPFKAAVGLLPDGILVAQKHGRSLERLTLHVVWLSAIAAAAPTGSIAGFVEDSSGAVIPKARIVLTSSSHSEQREAVSDQRGAFEFPSLSPDSWKLWVEAAGFKRAEIDPVVVRVDQTTRADVQLEIGDVSETIEVRGDVSSISPNRATMTSVFDNRIIGSMPLNGRQFLDVALFAPGVVPAAPGTQGSGFSAAGVRSQSNVYLLDGISNIDTQTNQPLNLFRIADAVQEFSVSTGGGSAAFGRGAGGQVNIVTKSGTNQFHGSAFEYVRNTDLNAADFFTNKLGGVKPGLHRNQFGGTIGGPIARGRTFFFGSYEGFRQVAPSVSSVLVPSAAQRASVSEPVSLRLLAFYPLPNATGSLNYISNVRALDSDDTGLVRIDHNLSGRDQLSARWTQYWGSSVVPGPTPLTGGNQGPLSQVSSVLSENHLFSPAFLNDLRLGFSRYAVQRTVQDQGLNAAEIFAGVPGVPANAGLPSISIGGGFAALGTNANFPQGRAENTIEIFDNATHVAPFGLSSHTWKWGAHIRRDDLSRYLDRSMRGSINFANFADFARGQLNSSTFRTGNTSAYWRRYAWDLYWQDEFRVTPGFRLSYGLRYEYPSTAALLRGSGSSFVPGYGPIVLGTNQIIDIDPARTGPVSLVYRSAPLSLPTSGAYADRNNVAPMLGFVDALGAAKRTVIRGAAQLAYDDLFNNVPSTMALEPPYSIQTTQTANVTQPGKFPWTLAFNQNVPLIANYGQQGPGTPQVGVLTFQSVDSHLRSAYAWLYHFGIQRQVRGVSIEADYQGSSGRNLGIYVDANQANVIVRDLSKRGPVAPNEQVFPYSHYGQAQIAKSIGNSNYNGLLLTAQHRARRGMFIQGSYRYGKSLDYNSSYFGSGNQPGETGAPIDARNLRLEHGPSAFDARHRFVALYAADLPLGIAISGVTTIQSGTPFTVVTGGQDTSGFNQTVVGASPSGGNRPDIIKSGTLPQDNRNPDSAFDTSWFAPNLAGRDGTAGRNQYVGPGLVNFDVAVAKQFRWRERIALELRADFFNVFNHTNFANPIADMSNANFGKITQTLGSAVATSAGTTSGPTGGPRLIQISARLRF